MCSKNENLRNKTSNEFNKIKATFLIALKGKKCSYIGSFLNEETYLKEHEQQKPRRSKMCCLVKDKPQTDTPFCEMYREDYGPDCTGTLKRTEGPSQHNAGTRDRTRRANRWGGGDRITRAPLCSSLSNKSSNGT